MNQQQLKQALERWLERAARDAQAMALRARRDQHLYVLGHVSDPRVMNLSDAIAALEQRAIVLMALAAQVRKQDDASLWAEFFDDEDKSV